MSEAETDRSLSHIDQHGQARMVDISHKTVTVREAEATGSVSMTPDTLATIRENTARKGDVLAVARIAGIQAAKKTSELIPLCHPLPISSVEVEFGYPEGGAALQVTARCRTESKTGVEMEALTAVAVACLTVYDMCKSIDREMAIGGVCLIRKSGGRSGLYERPSRPAGAP